MVKRGLITLLVFLTGTLVSAEASVSGSIVKMGETVHLEFLGLGKSDYEITRKEDAKTSIYELQIPKIDTKLTGEIKNFKSAEIKSIQVEQSEEKQKTIIKIQFFQKSFEAFDYLTDQPTRMIVDFFPSEASTLKKVAAKKSEPKPAAGPTADAQVKDLEFTQDTKTTTAQADKKDRNPASTDVLVVKQAEVPPVKVENIESRKQTGIFDGGDPNFTRFNIADYEIKQEAIVASRENVFIEFPMLRLDLPLLHLINSRKPIYEIDPQDNDENKQARLLVTLFERKRYLVFLKTLEWFQKKYPESKYDEVIRFMWADVLFSMWLKERDHKFFDYAMIRYKQAVEKYPMSSLVERTQLLMGFATLDRGDYMSTLKLFLSNLKNRPDSPNRDSSRFAVAEAYLKINRYDDTTAVYEAIEADATFPRNKIMAAYLKGDSSFQKKDYPKAIAEYQRALTTYPEGADDHPNAWFNQAGALFWNGQFRESLSIHIEFLKRFPNHTYAGYAMTRIGELLEILGAEKTRVMGVFLETYFRYGETPGAVVARLRMLSERMKNMKEKDMEKAVQDITQLSLNSRLPKIEQFATIMIANGYAQRMEFDKSIDLLVKYYQDHPTTADTLLLANRIIKNINQMIKVQVENGKYIEALRTHNLYSDSWLKGTLRIDTKYYVGRAFEQAGVFKEADKLYRDTLNKILSISGTSAEMERNVFERLPSTDEVYLRLAAVNVRENKFSQAYDFIKQIKNPDKLSDPMQIERVYLGATLLEKKGDSESAIRYLLELIKSWKGQPELVAQPYFDLGELELRVGKRDDAIKSFEKVDSLMDESGKIPISIHSAALEKLAQLHIDKGDMVQATAALSKLLDLYEKTKPMDSIRYRLGKLQFDQGQIQKAVESWEPLKNKPNQFWYRLSQEQVNGSNWKDDYKKYLKRIPAMADGSEVKQ